MSCSNLHWVIQSAVPLLNPTKRWLSERISFVLNLLGQLSTLQIITWIAEHEYTTACTREVYEHPPYKRRSCDPNLQTLGKSALFLCARHSWATYSGQKQSPQVHSHHKCTCTSFRNKALQLEHMYPKLILNKCLLFVTLWYISSLGIFFWDLFSSASEDNHGQYHGQ